MKQLDCYMIYGKFEQVNVHTHSFRISQEIKDKHTCTIKPYEIKQFDTMHDFKHLTDDWNSVLNISQIS